MSLSCENKHLSGPGNRITPPFLRVTRLNAYQLFSRINEKATGLMLPHSIIAPRVGHQSTGSSPTPD